MCSLERFRSLQDKLVLLDEAVAGHDGNVITAVSPTGAVQGWDLRGDPTKAACVNSQLASSSCRMGFLEFR